jgi:hypothetical protein
MEPSGILQTDDRFERLVEVIRVPSRLPTGIPRDLVIWLQAIERRAITSAESYILAPSNIVEALCSMAGDSGSSESARYASRTDWSKRPTIPRKLAY